MRIAAIACFVLSGVLLLSGINTVINAGAENGGRSASYDLGYYIGAFLPAMVFLILALTFQRKAKQAAAVGDDEADDFEQEPEPR